MGHGGGLLHDAAAELDHHDLAAELANPAQGLDQHIGFLDRSLQRSPPSVAPKATDQSRFPKNEISRRGGAHAGKLLILFGVPGGVNRTPGAAKPQATHKRECYQPGPASHAPPNERRGQPGPGSQESAARTPVGLLQLVERGEHFAVVAIDLDVLPDLAHGAVGADEERGSLDAPGLSCQSGPFPARRRTARPRRVRGRPAGGNSTRTCRGTAGGSRRCRCSRPAVSRPVGRFRPSDRGRHRPRGCSRACRRGDRNRAPRESPAVR